MRGSIFLSDDRGRNPVGICILNVLYGGCAEIARNDSLRALMSKGPPRCCVPVRVAADAGNRSILATD